jgi:cyclase
MAWLQPNGDWGEANAAVVLAGDQALLVDTLWTPALAKRMLDAVAARSSSSIRTVVNTHSDGDHVWGNQLLAGAEIVATRKAAEIIRAEPPSELQRLRAVAPLLSHVPVLGTVGEYVARMLAPYDFGEVTVTPPTREFEGAEELDVGGRTVRLEEVGPAHTHGDLIVHVPDARVVIAGDILFAGAHPVMWAGPTSNWIAALERVIALEPRAVIPGHGPVCAVAEAETLRDYFTWLQDAALPQLERGSKPSAVALELTGGEEFRGAPWSGWLGPERMVITIATIDRHRRGAAGPIGSRERAGLFRQAADVARKLGSGRSAGQM